MRKAVCKICKKKSEHLLFVCKFCKGAYCTIHRLPESHKCKGLVKYKKEQEKLLKEKGRPKVPIEYFYEKPLIKYVSKRKEEIEKTPEVSKDFSKFFEDEFDKRLQPTKNERKPKKQNNSWWSVILVVVVIAAFFYYAPQISTIDKQTLPESYQPEVPTESRETVIETPGKKQFTYNASKVDLSIFFAGGYPYIWTDRNITVFLDTQNSDQVGEATLAELELSLRGGMSVWNNKFQGYFYFNRIYNKENADIVVTFRYPTPNAGIAGRGGPTNYTFVDNHWEIYNGIVEIILGYECGDHTVAHELGHALGLDHQYKTRDVMSYHSGCEVKITPLTYNTLRELYSSDYIE